MVDVNTLVKGCKDLDIKLTDEQISKFTLYKELLLEWNQKINITAIEDEEEIDIKHFLDSLTILKTGLFKSGVKVIDIGTGGGFPGLPLKIVDDSIDLVLLDSLNKRINFLDEVIKSANLGKTVTIHGRAEDYGQDKSYRESFDIATSRAVASLDILCEYSLPFVKVGGYFIAMKGKEIDEELKEAERAIKLLGGEVVDKMLVEVPNSKIVHSLIICKKVSETPTKYPRQAGKPKKNPL